MISQISILIGKLSYFILQKLGKKGTAFPGKIAMKIQPDILKDLSSKCEKIAIITGTNGKTTTNNISYHIFNGKYDEIVSNLNGSNMIQGVISPFLINNQKHYDWGIFEVDEGSMSNVGKYASIDYVILTNIFRDQLDRYGEVENIIKLVYDSLKNSKTTLILNADSPISLYFNDLPNPKIYYSLKRTKFSKKKQTVDEFVSCPKCGNKLKYEYINYGNIGKFFCTNCGAKNPNPDYEISKVELINGFFYKFNVSDKNDSISINLNLPGIYNLYNALGAISLARENKISYDIIKKQIENFKYERGRMENIKIASTEIILVLSKNPVSLSEVFTTIKNDTNNKSLMLILNDYAPDGRDTSWIWDVYFEEILNIENIDKFYCVGTRAEEVALRLKYIDFPEEKIEIYHSKDEYDIKNPISSLINNEKKVYIIGTFTAVPEARKELMNLKNNQ